jgi:hypothetical protein
MASVMASKVMPSSPLRFSSRLSESCVSFLMAARCISSALRRSTSLGLNRSSVSEFCSISTPALARISSIFFWASWTWAATSCTCWRSAWIASFLASMPVRSRTGSHQTASSAAHAATGHHELPGASIGTASLTTTRRAFSPASVTMALDQGLSSFSTHRAVDRVSRRPERSSTVWAISISRGRRSHAASRALTTATPSTAGRTQDHSMVRVGAIFWMARASTTKAMATVSITTAWRIHEASTRRRPALAMTSRIGSMVSPCAPRAGSGMGGSIGIHPKSTPASRFSIRNPWPQVAPKPRKSAPTPPGCYRGWPTRLPGWGPRYRTYPFGRSDARGIGRCRAGGAQTATSGIGWPLARASRRAVETDHPQHRATVRGSARRVVHRPARLRGGCGPDA